MNKKLTTIAGAIALSSMMVGATAYGAVSGTSGYDLYKQALKNTVAAQSITPATEVTMQDNGQLLLKANDTAKLNRADKTMSNSVTVISGNQQKTMDMYRQNGQTIMKTSDSAVYNVMDTRKTGKAKNIETQKEDSSRIQDIENVADALVGNIQNYISLQDNQDGTKEVSLELSESQVSPVVNAAASLAVKNAEAKANHQMNMGNSRNAFAAGLLEKMPKLVQNIRVSKVDVDAKISSDNLIQSQSELFTITGTDASGKNHVLTINVNTTFSGINATTPDKVDLTGKQVKTMSNRMQWHGERMGE